MGAWRSSMPPRTTRASTRASLRTAEGRPTALATSPSQVRGCMSLLKRWFFPISIISKMQTFLSIRGDWHYCSSWRLWGEGWRRGGSEVRGVVRPHAGHHIYLGYRLQGHRLWLGVAALWTSLGRMIPNSYSSTLLLQFSFTEKAAQPQSELVSYLPARWRQRRSENKECPNLARRSLHVHSSNSGGQRHGICRSKSCRSVLSQKIFYIIEKLTYSSPSASLWIHMVLISPFSFVVLHVENMN